MARKTTGTTTTTTKRSKKTENPAVTVQAVPKIREEGRTKGTRVGQVPVNLAPETIVASENIPASENIDEQIRRRAYELYLQRSANGGGENGDGDEHQDWLTAEHEIRSRQGGHKGRGVAAGGSQA